MTESGSIVLCDVHLVLWCSWFGNRKDIQPVKCWVLVCWWWSFDWSFARLISAVITITSSPPPFLAPIKSRMETFWWSKRVGWDGLDMLKYSCRGKWPLNECRYDVWTGNRPGTFYIRVLPGEFTWSSVLPRCWLSNRKGSRLVYNLTPAIPVVFIQKLMMSWRNPWWRWKIGSLCAFYQVYLCWPVVAIKLFPRNFRFFCGWSFFHIYTHYYDIGFGCNRFNASRTIVCLPATAICTVTGMLCCVCNTCVMNDVCPTAFYASKREISTHHLTAVFPCDPGLAGCPLNSPSPVIP